MAAEFTELRPGPHELVIVPGKPLGRKSRDFLNATLGTKGQATHEAYGVAVEMTSWHLQPMHSQKPMIERFHILPREGAVIIEGPDVPSSYPISPDAYGSSGRLSFTHLVAETMSGTIKIEYQTEIHGEPIRRKLDFTRHGQLTLQRQDTELPEEPKPVLHIIEGKSVVIPGYDTAGPEIDP